MANAATFTDVSGGVLDTGFIDVNYHSATIRLEYTGDDDNDLCESLQDYGTIDIATDAVTSGQSGAITVTALPCTLPANTVLNFHNGVNVRLTAQANRKATSISISATDPFTGANHGAIPVYNAESAPGGRAYCSSLMFKKSSDTNWRFGTPLSRIVKTNTLKLDITAASTTWTMDFAANIQDMPATFTVWLGTELVSVTSVSGTTWTVQREQAGGSAAAATNAAGTIVYVREERLLAGGVLDLASGTPYDFRCNLPEPTTDTETIVTNTGANGKTTRTDAITAPDALTPTHYVDGTVAGVGGATPGDGSSGSKWKRLRTAMTAANAASGDMVIQVGGGYYRYPYTGTGATVLALSQATHNVAFVAANNATCVRAVNANRELQTPSGFTPTLSNPGHPVVYDRYTSPTGSGDAALFGTAAQGWAEGFGGEGPWTASVQGGTTLYYLDIKQTDGSTADNLEVYALAYSTVSGGNFAAAKAALSSRVGHWKHFPEAATPDLNTVAGFGEIVRTNRSYNSGFWQDMDGSASAGTDASRSRLWLRLPNDLNPNTCYVWFGQGARTDATSTIGFSITAQPGTDDPGHRICGIRFKPIANAVRIGPGANNTLVDYCYTENVAGGVLLNGDGGSVDLSGCTIQDSRFQDTNIWKGNPVTDRGIPWPFIKQEIITSAGAYYSIRDIGGSAESTTLMCNRNARQFIFRRCTMDGMFNGDGRVNKSQIDYLDAYGCDVYQNTYHNIGDNCFEPAGHSIAYKVWDCTVTESANILETDSRYGPLILARIKGWRIANHGITDNNAITSQTFEVGANAGAIKCGAPNDPQARVWLLHWTVWNDKNHPSVGAGINPNPSFKFWHDAVNGSWRADTYSVHSSTIRARGEVIDAAVGSPVRWYEDYNVFASQDGSNSFKVNGTLFGNTNPANLTNGLAAYRRMVWATRAIGATILRGSTTNKLGGTDYNLKNGAITVIDSPTTGFTDVSTGVLTIPATSVLYRTGAPLPNASDLPGTHYTAGSPPDRGYFVPSTASDTTAPTISSVSVGTPTPTSFPVTFTADEPSQRRVKYWRTADQVEGDALFTTYTDSLLAGAQTIPVSGLTASTSYTGKAQARDQSLNVGTQSDTFTQTTATPDDVTAPVVTEGPTATELAGVGVDIAWDTNEAATRQVKYWRTLTQTEDDAAFTTEETNLLSEHIVRLPFGDTNTVDDPLETNTPYTYRVLGKDQSQNQMTSATATFTTSPVVVVTGDGTRTSDPTRSSDATRSPR